MDVRDPSPPLRLSNNACHRTLTAHCTGHACFHTGLEPACQEPTAHENTLPPLLTAPATKRRAVTRRPTPAAPAELASPVATVPQPKAKPITPPRRGTSTRHPSTRNKYRKYPPVPVPLLDRLQRANKERSAPPSSLPTYVPPSVLAVTARTHRWSNPVDNVTPSPTRPSSSYTPPQRPHGPRAASRGPTPVTDSQRLLPAAHTIPRRAVSPGPPLSRVVTPQPALLSRSAQAALLLPMVRHDPASQSPEADAPSSPPLAPSPPLVVPRNTPVIPLRHLRTWPPNAPPADPRAGMATLVIPLHCRHCHTRLRWAHTSPLSPFTLCDNCMLSAFIRPRSIPSPAELPSSIPIIPSDAKLPLRYHQPTVETFPPFSPDDYRWAALRKHPSRDIILVYRYHLCIAALSLRHAQYLRALILASLPTLSDSFRINESDITAHFIAIILSAPPSSWPRPPMSPFRGDQHVFMDYRHALEPGFTRPASLPISLGPLFPFDPSVSAFASISDATILLSSSGAYKHLRHHPLFPFIFNNIRCGTSLLSEPPVLAREPERRAHATPHPMLRQQELIELDNNAVADATLWPHGVPLRFAPWFLVTRNGKGRGVSDFTYGDGSTNSFTRRHPLLPSRLASWTAVAQRIVFMREQRPGVRILLAKLDAKRAFRQLPLPLRDYWKTAHVFSSVPVYHTRLPFGATNSGDSMSCHISAIQDLAAELGIFTQSYIDDQLLIEYEDRMPSSLSTLMSLWDALGWPVSMEKLQSEGAPSTQKEFLGVMINTESCTASVTPKRMAKLHSLIDDLCASTVSLSPKALQSLAGSLNFISAVIPFGRVFLKRLYSHPPPRRHFHSSALFYDLRWWQHALHAFNGVASFAPVSPDTPSLAISTDAAKSGFGVFSPSSDEWASGSWSLAELDNSSTAHWETAAILIACDLFGPRVSGGILHVFSDSKAAESVLNSCRAHDLRMFELLRYAVSLQLRHNFRLVVRHIDGVSNGQADHISRTLSAPINRPRAIPLNVSLSTRNFIGQLLSTSRHALSPALPLVSPGATTGNGTATTSSTSPSRTLPWILWRTLPPPPSATDVFSR